MFQLKVKSYGTVGRGDYRNYYRGHMDKIKGEGGGGERRWVQLGQGGWMGRKGILYLSNNKNLKNNNGIFRYSNKK